MQASKKAIVIIIIVSIALTAFAMAVAFNLGKLGETLSGIGGPIGTQVYNAFNGVPKWISSNGWPSLVVGILLFVVAWPCIVAYIVWTKDIPYKITGTPTADNTHNDIVQREPADPETLTKATQ